MSGYTPVFGSLFKGSLCGQWPTLPVFCTLLPLCDKNGHLDYSFAYLAATTGWPEDLLRQGISALEQPDPASRSDADDGRRLVRLREHTDWGWRVVNHDLYREKARLAAKNAREVEAGKNTERMAHRRRPDATRESVDGPPVTAGDRRGPPVTDPSNANANAEKKIPTVSVEPKLDDPVFRVFQHWQSAHDHPQAKLDEKRRKVIRNALKTYPEEALRSCIEGYKHSPHHQGKNATGTVYDSIELMLRDAQHIDAGIKLANGSGGNRWI